MLRKDRKSNHIKFSIKSRGERKKEKMQWIEKLQTW